MCVQGQIGVSERSLPELCVAARGRFAHLKSDLGTWIL